MRGKPWVLGVIGAAALLAMSVGGCAGKDSPDNAAAASPSPTAVASTTTVTDTALPQVVHARVGDTINVLLHSNASTGYRWVAQDLNDAAVLKQDGDGKVIAPKQAAPGAPGHTQFAFIVMKEGVDEIGFWYQPPASGPAGATWALVVQASAGHIPVNVDAGEDYTAETAQLRTGDDLLVTIDDAANAGRHSWQMVGGSPLVKLVSQKFSSGTQQMTFAGVSAGTGTLVLVNRPTGDPPLQTYALPLAVKAPKAPVTIQLNKKSAEPANQNVLAKTGDTIQVSLEDQPSTDFQWKFQKPDAKVLKQVGQPRFFANSSAHGLQGQDGLDVQRGRPGQDAAHRGLPAGAGAGDAGQDVAGRRRREAGLHAQDRRRRLDVRRGRRARAARRPDQAQAGLERGGVVQACLDEAARRVRAREAGPGRSDHLHGEA